MSSDLSDSLSSDSSEEKIPTKKSKTTGKSEKRQSSAGTSKDEAPAKKSKTSEKSKGGDGTRDGDGNLVFELNKNKQVTIRSFRGVVYVDIREFYLDKASGSMKPGKKGISLSKEQWYLLKNHMDGIDAELECF